MYELYYIFAESSNDEDRISQFEGQLSKALLDLNMTLVDIAFSGKGECPEEERYIDTKKLDEKYEEKFKKLKAKYNPEWIKE